MVAATVHIDFCVQLYRDQLNMGRYVLHEHTDAARSRRCKPTAALAAEALRNKAAIGPEPEAEGVTRTVTKRWS